MASITQNNNKSNMGFYNKYRAVPDAAKKTIAGGRLKGFTDINPMWRIQSLTEAFGPVGIGWYAEILNRWIEDGAYGEKTAQVEAALYIKVDGEWSKPVTGVGGSMLVTKEGAGLRTSDEAFKMAYTDAISVACKMMGMGADVYWAEGRTKYDVPAEEPEKKQKKPSVLPVCVKCGKKIESFRGRDGVITSPFEWERKSLEKYGKCLCKDCIKGETDNG